MVTITAHLRVDLVTEFYHSKAHQSKVNHYLRLYKLQPDKAKMAKGLVPYVEVSW